MSSLNSRTSYLRSLFLVIASTFLLGVWMLAAPLVQGAATESFAITPTPTPIMPTPTNTGTPPTATASPTFCVSCPTATPTLTSTPTWTRTPCAGCPTATFTSTRTGTPPTSTPTPTFCQLCPTATNTPVPTSTYTATYTRTAIPTRTGTPGTFPGCWSISSSPNPGPSYNLLHAISARAANDVWAVGTYFQGGYRNLIIHWDGASWSEVPAPQPGNGSQLRGVSARAVDDAWAVGYFEVGGGYRRLMALHWNGASWSEASLPNVSSPTHELYAVEALAAGNVWAVGSGYSSTLILHWDGVAWIQVSSPDGGQYNWLRGISAISPNDIWAVGYSTQGGTGRTLTLHWDGGGWSLIPSPNVGSNSNSLYAVDAVSGHDVWAVGWSSSGGPLAMRWDGSEWAIVSTPSPGSGGDLVGVTALAPDDVWAVGRVTGASNSEPLLLNWDGWYWQVAPGPYAGIGAQLYGVSAAGPLDVWAVGMGAGTLVEHYSGFCPTPTPTLTPTLTRTPTITVTGTPPTAIPSPTSTGGIPRTPTRTVTPDMPTGTSAAQSATPVSTAPPPPSITTLPSATPDNTTTPGTPQATSTPYLDLQGYIRTEQLVPPCLGWRFYLVVRETTNGYVPVATRAHFRNMHGDFRIFDVPPFSGSYTIECTAVPCSQGAYSYFLTVDYDNAVHETNELNNGYSYSRFSDPPCTPTPTRTPTAATSVPSATSTSVPATPTACTITFSDVPPDHTFYAFIRCLACRGVLGGYADGTFLPGNNITRGQIAKVVSNAAGLTGTPTGQTYTDVPHSHTFYEWIERLSNLGVMGGYPCGGAGEPCDDEERPYFRPQNNATRGQLSKIVAEAGAVGGTPTGQTYADVLPDHPFYLWIERLTALGVMGGYQCGQGPGEPCDWENRPYFRPGVSVTRGQAARIVANTFFPGCVTP